MSAPPVSGDFRRADDEQSFLFGAVIASALIGFGLSRRTTLGTAAGIAGAGMLAALVAPRVAARATVSPSSRRPVNVTTELVLQRPRAAVFDFFHNFENFPLLGGIVDGIEDFDDGRSRWRVRGRGGTIEWDVIVTRYLPPAVIGWESIAGSPVESHGMVRLEALDDSATRVSLTVDYRPISEEAIRAFQRIPRPERVVKNATARVDAAMERSLEPDVHHRAPRFPLPDSPQTTALLPSSEPDRSS